MASATLFPNAPDVSADDYCVFGLATCFFREDSEVKQVQIVEPIPSSALETLLKGVPTSYQLACAQSLAAVFSGETLQMPTEFPTQAQFCENFTQRAVAAARTYKSRPEAKQHIPLGAVKEDFNYSLERKRILNAAHAVSAEDNVKQHSHTHKVL